MSGRRKRDPIAPPARTSTTLHQVVRGSIVFELTHAHVRCTRCNAIQATGGNGDAVQSFFAAHDHKPPAAPPAPGVRERIAAALEQLGPDELEVLAEVAGGLQRGRGVYGELRIDSDTRDHDREALDEVRDGLVYAAVAAIKRRRASAGKETPKP